MNLEVLISPTKDVNAGIDVPLNDCVGDALCDRVLHLEVK